MLGSGDETRHRQFFKKKTKNWDHPFRPLGGRWQSPRKRRRVASEGDEGRPGGERVDTPTKSTAAQNGALDGQ